MRVAELDMTNNTIQCHSSFRQLTTPRRSCGTMNPDIPICSSGTFSVGDVEYSKVCGRIRGYLVTLQMLLIIHMELKT